MAKTIKIDWGLWRVIAMTWAITELAKCEEERWGLSVITSRPIAFWWNPYIKSVHKTDELDLYKNVIKGTFYYELEPYTCYKFYDEWESWLSVAKRLLEWVGLECEWIPQPCLYLAEHERYKNRLEGKTPNSKVVLFQPFGSTMDKFWCDKSYRSFKVDDAQWIADELNKRWYTVYQVFDKEKQPALKWCVECSNKNLRWIISLADRYPVIWCDSCMHHAAKAFWKQSMVMRAATDPWRYWYEWDINLWEKWMVEHTPMRLWQLWFDTDIINQFSNQFSPEFLNNFVDICEKFLQSRYK